MNVVRDVKKNILKGVLIATKLKRRKGGNYAKNSMDTKR